jgi:diguanylate cyclase (GGDEF)-like protein
MDADMLPPEEAMLRDLIRCLPIPVVLLAAADGSCFSNQRFTEIFAPDQLGSPEFRDLAHRATGIWESVTLRGHDGSNVEAQIQIVAVPIGFLLVVDELSGPPSVAYEHLHKRVVELECLSATDRLTGAWNRTHLEQTIGVEISRAARSSQPVTLVLLDIDHFKRVNDTYGHLAGDELLRALVRRLRERIRASDSLFRWGGEEFVILATGVGFRGGAVLAESLREAIAAQPFAPVGAITASLGVAEYLRGESAEEWFERTDRALYAAKSGGRNRIFVCQEGASDQAMAQSQVGVLRLSWHEAYECGEPAINDEHRQLFDLAIP